MSDILAKIMAEKERELEILRPRCQAEDWLDQARRLPPPPGFLAALRQPGRMRVIAEIKKASPSAGVLRDPFDPPAIARDYQQHGADCLSVLTDEKYFQGSIDYLRAVREAVSLPLLRKEFVIDEAQIYEARLAGAAAVLLIAECLDDARLAELVRVIEDLRMTALVELHDADRLDGVIASGAKLIGVNNRDLRTFRTDLATTIDLLPRMPADVVVVSESGVKTPDDIRRLADAGVHAVLVGETFMRAPSPGAKLAELLAS